MNGKPLWNGKPKGTRGSICVKPEILPENEKICKYLKTDNSKTWKQSEVHIEVKRNCTGTPLKHNSCFGVLQGKDCEHSCMK